MNAYLYWTLVKSKCHPKVPKENEYDMRNTKCRSRIILKLSVKWISFSFLLFFRTVGINHTFLRSNISKREIVDFYNNDVVEFYDVVFVFREEFQFDWINLCNPYMIWTLFSDNFLSLGKKHCTKFCCFHQMVWWVKYDFNWWYKLDTTKIDFKSFIRR